MIQHRSLRRSVTEVRLVEAAAQLFARHGFKAATTKEIATLADLNEATLFRYFPRKPDLFLAALESHLSRIKLSHELQASLAADENPEVVLPKVISFILGTLMTQPELQHLIHVASFELPEADHLIRDHFGPIFDTICAYFKRSSDKGTIRDFQPQLAALGLLGCVSAHHVFGKFSDKEFRFDADADRAGVEFANLWLHGIMPVPEVGRRP